MRLLRLLPAVLVSVVLVASPSCTSEDDAEPGDTTGGTPAATPAPTTVEVVPIPDGAQAIVVDELGVQFGAPEGWEIVDPDELEGGTSGTVVAELAERAGVTPEEMSATIDEQVELYVFSDQPDEGFTPNINVVATETDALPTDEQLTAQFDDVGARNVQIERSTEGDAVSVGYSVNVGESRARGVTLFATVGEQVVNVTVTSTKRRDADDIGELIASTLGPAG